MPNASSPRGWRGRVRAGLCNDHPSFGRFAGQELLTQLPTLEAWEMAGDRWLTFDCYGTIADWNTCMRQALEPVVGDKAPVLLTAYHQAELIFEAEQWRPYRDVLTDGLALAARFAGVS